MPDPMPDSMGFERSPRLTTVTAALHVLPDEIDRAASILADAFEAVLAAVYLDGGFDAARRFVRARYDARIGKLDPARDGKDAKTRLQEFLQARHCPLPAYRIVEVGGEAHAQSFEVVCEIARPATSTTGRGRSRRLAEQEAAAAALGQLESEK